MIIFGIDVPFVEVILVLVVIIFILLIEALIVLGLLIRQMNQTKKLGETVEQLSRSLSFLKQEELKKMEKSGTGKK